MAILPTRSFETIVSDIAAGMQGRINAFLNFAVGSVFLAIAEAYAGVALWLQSIALQIALLTRLATSYGPDVDTWLADWDLITRIGSVAATGLVVFSRASPSAAAPVITVGATVKTQDGKQSFQVYADTNNAAYSASANGYIMPPQVTSLIVPVISITPSPNGKVINGVVQPGANGNVSAGAISLISSQITGIDKVTNPAALTNGIDSESDPDVKARFVLAVQARGGGTVPAIQSAVANLRAGMSALVLENQDLDGGFEPGMVTVIVDDGSGEISSALLVAAQAAVEAVRAGSIRTGVYSATRTLANVAMQILVAQGYVRQVVVAQVSAALGLYINGLGQGVTLEYFDLPAIAKTVPGCLGVVSQSYSLNGGSTDIAGTPQTTIKAASLVVS